MPNDSTEIYFLHSCIFKFVFWEQLAECLGKCCMGEERASRIIYGYHCRSISQLIQENIDYITDALLFKLKHASSHPEIPHIVQALVKHGSRDAMGLVEDVGYEACTFVADFGSWSLFS